MPKPIILLENHMHSSAKRFVSEHILALKRLGYTKFLFEMSSDVEPESLKSSLVQIISTAAKTSREYLGFKSFLDLMNTLELHKIAYDFIDPESFSKAATWDRTLKSATSAKEFEKLYQQRMLDTEQRDAVMSQIIKAETANHHGGIIMLTGFSHKTLAKKLQKIDPDHVYSSIIFTDRRENTPLTSHRTLDIQFAGWMNLHDKPYRDAYYETNVHLFDMANLPPFGVIEETCGLSVHTPCRQIPRLGEYLNRALERPLTYSLDEGYVLRGSIDMEPSEERATSDMILTRCPGLSFFSRQERGRTTLHIPGLNLPENIARLERSFKQCGIM